MLSVFSSFHSIFHAHALALFQSSYTSLITHTELRFAKSRLLSSLLMFLASTMACISEALGMSPLGSACPPANGSQRLRVAELTGKLAVSSSLPKPSEILTRKSFENAITVLQALGGSTNAVVHLLAIAGRVEGVDLTLEGQHISMLSIV